MLLRFLFVFAILQCVVFAQYQPRVLRTGTSSVPGISITVNGDTLILGGTATNSTYLTGADIVLLRTIKNQETVASNNGTLLSGSTIYTSGTMIGRGTDYTTLRPGDQIASNAAGDYGNGEQAGPQFVQVVLSATTARVTKTVSSSAYSAAERVYRAPISAVSASGSNVFCFTNTGLFCIGQPPSLWGFGDATGNGGNNAFYVPTKAALGSLTITNDAILSSGGWQSITTFGSSPSLILGGTNAANGSTVGNITIGGKLTVGQGINGGIGADGGGFKHGRISTGSIAGGSSALVYVPWTTAFADASYSVSAQVEDSTATSLSLSVVHVEAKTSGSCGVRIINNAVTAITGTLNVIAIHD